MKPYALDNTGSVVYSHQVPRKHLVASPNLKPIVVVENVSKRYRLRQGEARYGTLRDSISQTVKTWSNSSPAKNGRAKPASIWALKDVSLEVQPGEVVGIIGRNGAGKSTLLKILSRITDPTEGRVSLYGRVASLLEVGTGFHLELTGRENIFLNGAILGMKKAEIERYFDDITEFAEIETFLDTPVKHYSSGMFMRLAFAVAAHLEPEILLVDEVLAVGDHDFQQKCLGKMNAVARGGRTVIFVSHNMAAVSQLCSRSFLLNEGRIVRSGPTAEVVAEYLRLNSDSGGERIWSDVTTAPGNDKIRLRSVRVVSNGTLRTEVDIDQEVCIEVEFANLVPGLKNICTNLYLLDSRGVVVLSTGNTPAANSLNETWFDKPHPAGVFRTRCTLPANFLNEGVYHVTVYVVTLGPITVHVDLPQAISFTVFDTGVMREPGGGKDWAGVIRMRLPWETDYLGEN